MSTREVKGLGETPLLKKRTRSQVQKDDSEKNKEKKRGVRKAKRIKRSEVKSKKLKKSGEGSSKLQLRDSSPSLEEVEVARAIVVYTGNAQDVSQEENLEQHAESLNSSETLHSKDTSKDSSRTVTNPLNPRDKAQESDEVNQDSTGGEQNSEDANQNSQGTGQDSDGTSDSNGEVFPPLPCVEVPLAEILKNRQFFDGFSRKATCQYNQKKLEEIHKDVWVPKGVSFSERFMTKEGSVRYEQLRERKILREKVLSSRFPQNRKLVVLLRKNGLLETVQDLETFSPEMILEFYSNFEALAENKHCLNFVFMRGRLFEFSPRFINLVLGTQNVPLVNKVVLNPGVSDDELISELTDGKLKHWKPFSSAFLAEKFKPVFGICCINWLPSSNTTYVSLDRAQLVYMVWNKIPVNFGQLIFDEIAKVVIRPEPGQTNRRGSLRYPSLITKVLSFQKEISLVPNERVMALKDYKVDERIKGSSGRVVTKFCLNCANRAGILKKRLRKIERLADKWAGGDEEDTEVEEVETEDSTSDTEETASESSDSD